MAVRDPLSHLDALISQYAAEDFVAQRKRLRDARMRWIEENEAPTAYQVTTQDKDGNKRTFSTPFQVGKIQYPDQYDDRWKEEGQKHHDPAVEQELLEGIEAILSESSTEKRLTVLVSGDEQHAFFTGGADTSHPPINEGEDYGEYYARVASGYEQAAGRKGTHAGRPVSSDDGVRESTPVDPARVGSADAPGDGPGRDAGTMLGGDPDTLRPGDEGPASAGSSASLPAAPDPAPASPD